MYTFEVAAIKDRVANTRNGPKKAYDLIGTDGTKYGFAFTDPARLGITVGSTVTANGSVGTYGISLEPKTASLGGTVSASPYTPKETSKSVSTHSGRAEKVFPLPPTHGDTAIIRQNALTNAVATVADFIATQPTEKWPDLNKWTDMVIDTAYKFAEFSSGQREVKATMKLMAAGVGAADINSAVQSHLGEDQQEDAA